MRSQNSSGESRLISLEVTQILTIASGITVRLCPVEVKVNKTYQALKCSLRLDFGLGVTFVTVYYLCIYLYLVEHHFFGDYFDTYSPTKY